MPVYLQLFVTLQNNMIKEMVLRVGLEPTCDHYRFYCV
nr:MAG TPA: hypothetical protein [Caudoviricetes sp.]